VADDLTLALELAGLADELTLGRYRAADLTVETKPDLTPVTEADKAVERVLRDRLAVQRPGDSVLGEEYGDSSAPGSSRRWIIDPIDGTMNYVRGVPVWATLIALQENGELTLGVASAPALHRCWWAVRGNGAFVDERLPGSPRAIHVSAVRDLADAQLCVPGFENWDGAVSLDQVLALARRCWRSRGFGDFWPYMLLAEGAADIVCEPAASLWDLAVPQVIVEEAGGRFTDLAGTPGADGGDALASNGPLHDAALTVVGR
jgi:histidinol-phosphatase